MLTIAREFDLGRKIAPFFEHLSRLTHKIDPPGPRERCVEASQEIDNVFMGYVRLSH